MNDSPSPITEPATTIASRARGVGKFGVLGMAAAAICCALPVLLSSGLVATAVGAGTGRWLLTALGLGLIVVALTRRRRRCSLQKESDDSPENTLTARK
ncbi:MAG: hypothetical protein HY826_11355 [Actinobacteria bacterium]|nr:hypothetical protein [Actinomycetota bacterium]